MPLDFIYQTWVTHSRHFPSCFVPLLDYVFVWVPDRFSCRNASSFYFNLYWFPFIMNIPLESSLFLFCHFYRLAEWITRKVSINGTWNVLCFNRTSFLFEWNENRSEGRQVTKNRTIIQKVWIESNILVLMWHDKGLCDKDCQI